MLALIQSDIPYMVWYGSEQTLIPVDHSIWKCRFIYIEIPVIMIKWSLFETGPWISGINSFVLRPETPARVIDRLRPCGLISVFSTYISLGCDHWCGAQLVSTIILFKYASVSESRNCLRFCCPSRRYSNVSMYYIGIVWNHFTFFLHKNEYVSFNIMVTQVYVRLSVCLPSIRMLETLRKSILMELAEISMKGWKWYNKQMFRRFRSVLD